MTLRLSVTRKSCDFFLCIYVFMALRLLVTRKFRDYLLLLYGQITSPVLKFIILHIHVVQQQMRSMFHGTRLHI